MKKKNIKELNKIKERIFEEILKNIKDLDDPDVAKLFCLISQDLMISICASVEAEENIGHILDGFLTEVKKGILLARLSRKVK